MPELTRTVVSIQGMDCIESAKVSLSAEKAYIRHSRDRLGLAQIRQAIEGAGARRSLLFKGANR